MNANESYIYGILITDGNLSLNKDNPSKGKVVLEVSEKDKDIVTKLFNVIPNSKIRSRTRDTNFKKGYTSYSFCNYQKEFREFLINKGFPVSNKTELANIPNDSYSIYDFWRGVIDGDGSLGISKALGNKPFLSLCTDAEGIKEGYLGFLKNEFGIIKKSSRNKRDNAYNIMIYGKKVIPIISKLYLENSPSLFIDRKHQKAIEICSYGNS